jgi:hypothetical protein
MRAFAPSRPSVKVNAKPLKVSSNVVQAQTTSSKPAPVKPAALPKPVATAKTTPAGGDDDWETF